jgi:hypothetical protein
VRCSNRVPTVDERRCGDGVRTVEGSSGGGHTAATALAGSCPKVVKPTPIYRNMVHALSSAVGHQGKGFPHIEETAAKTVIGQSRQGHRGSRAPLNAELPSWIHIRSQISGVGRVHFGWRSTLAR